MGANGTECPDIQAFRQPDVRHRHRHGGAGVLGAHRPRAGRRQRVSLRSRYHAHHPRRLRPQPPGDDPGLSRHRKVDPHRAGGGAPQLALHPHQSRQPHQPHRPDRQGRDRDPRRGAGDRVSRGPAALGAAAPDRAGLRRVRRRAARRDVRDPAHPRGRRQAHPARPEPGGAAASRVPHLRHHQHGGPGRHHRPLSRHAADQPGSDGPLEPGGDAQLSRP